MPEISASILSCDTMQMGRQITEAEQGGADYIHVDVMDGVYVGNLSFGPQVVKDIRRICTLPISVHLELFHPENFLSMFSGTGVDSLTFQLDACHNPIHLLNEIHKAGMRTGIGIGPAYTVENLKYLLHLTDRIILMSVEPGYGGQKFEESIFEKMRRIKEIMDEAGVHVPVAIDGGVNPDTGKKLVDAGADILIVGSGIFKEGSIADNIKKMKNL